VSTVANVAGCGPKFGGHIHVAIRFDHQRHSGFEWVAIRLTTLGCDFEVR